MNDDDLWLSAALDGELDAVASLGLERRLAGEPALKAKWDELRALRDALQARATRHDTPDALHALVEGMAASGNADTGAGMSASGDADTDTGRRGRMAMRRRGAFGGFARPWRHAAGGALVASLLTLAIVSPRTLHPGGDTGATDRRIAAAGEAAEAVSAHTRAMLVDHPIEVASSDQHTVRPWLSARLNFVPPVVDLAAQGFVLLGARRDVVAGETAAALVYRHGAHVISVFVRPVAGGDVAGPEITSVVRGFNVVQSTHAGMAFCLVSDLNSQDLQALARLLATGPPS